jgi:hypothetical protein
MAHLRPTHDEGDDPIDSRRVVYAALLPYTRARLSSTRILAFHTVRSR